MTNAQPDLLKAAGVKEPKQAAAKTKIAPARPAKAQVIPPERTKKAKQAVAVVKPKRQAVAKEPPRTMMEMIDSLVRDKNFDERKLVVILEEKRKEEDRQAERAFNAAMKACQEELPIIIKDGKSDKHKYAKLESIQLQCMPIINKHGFTPQFSTRESPVPGQFFVTCKLSHTEGHSREYEVPVAIDDKGAKGGDVKTVIQGMGSAVTYGRRYLLTNIFNLTIVGQDNDGAAAAKPAPLIAQKQCDDIRDLMQVKGVTTASLIEWLASKNITIERVEDIKASDFNLVMGGLRAARAAD